MTDYLTTLLFRPKELGRYRFAKLYKVFFILFILTIITIIPEIIDVAKFSGLSLSDRYQIESEFNVRFSEMAKKLPDCMLENNELICTEPTDPVEIGTISTLFGNYVIVIAPENYYPLKTSKTFLILQKDGLLYANSYAQFLISYDRLPSEWTSVDFMSIREDENPDVALYQYFIDGLNPIIQRLKPLTIVFLLIVNFLAYFIRTLFISFLFYLFFRQNRFGHVFRVSAYAQIFPSIILLILGLLRMEQLSVIATVITFIYMYKALVSNQRKILE